MAVVIKTGPIEVDANHYAELVEPPYKGSKPLVGDTAYLWICGHSAEGLAFEARIRSVEEAEARHLRIGVRVLRNSLRQPIGLADIRPHRDSPSTEPTATLAKKLYKHSHRKVADLTDAEANYLSARFEVE